MSLQKYSDEHSEKTLKNNIFQFFKKAESIEVRDHMIYFTYDMDWSACMRFISGLGIGVGVGIFLNKFIIPTPPPGKGSNSVDDEDSNDSDEEEEWEDESDDSDADMMKMVLVVRTDLKMTKGKIAAQCGHAAVSAYKKAKRKDPRVLKSWESEGQRKIAVKVKDENELLTIMAMAQSVNLITAIIQDAGRTQIEAGSKTVVAVGPGPEDVIDKVTGHLSLL